MSKTLTLALGDPDRALTLLGEGPARAATEVAVRSFLFGAREFDEHAPSWAQPLERLAARHRPFAWEGVGLAAATSQRGVDPVLESHPEQAAWIFVGVGWALALRGEVPQTPPAHWLDRYGELAWTSFDGLGFAATLLRRRKLDSPSPWFDQGLGRALYFIHAGRPEAIARMIDALDDSRRAASWRGVGIASIVTGGLEPDSLVQLLTRGGEPLLEGRFRAGALLGSIE
jgi:hypothetical protein